MKFEKAVCIVALVLIFTALCSAQNAKVIQLKPEDAVEAKTAYDEMKSAEKKWSDLQTKLQSIYKGFEAGIEFSSDFKFIVPKQGLTLATWPNYCSVIPAAGNFSNATTCGNCIISSY